MTHHKIISDPLCKNELGCLFTDYLIWVASFFLVLISFSREPSSRNMRHMLASVILRFLGSRVVHADAIISFYPPTTESSHAQAKWEMADSPMIEASAAATPDLAGESLFEWFLSVFHGLLGNCKPCWLKSEPSSKSTIKSARDSVFDREAVESLQVRSVFLISFFFLLYFLPPN